MDFDLSFCVSIISLTTEEYKNDGVLFKVSDEPSDLNAEKQPNGAQTIGWDAPKLLDI